MFPESSGRRFRNRRSHRREAVAIAAEIHIPFRFPKREAKRLLQLAQLFAAEKAPGERHEDVGLLIAAAKAANDGEPLVVVVESGEEAQAMADAFVRLGFSRPAIG